MEGDSEDTIITRLIEGLSVKAYPGDFIGADYEGEYTDIPEGKEVSMYRELEGVFVMIDGERLFFNNPVYAKFIFYSAKAGLRRVRVPEAKLARKANRGLEQEIESLVYELKARIEKMNRVRPDPGEFLEHALERLGAGYYSDIVSSEDLW